MKTIEVPIKLFKGDEEELERRKLLGLDEEDFTDDVIMTVYTNHIVGHLPSKEGHTILYLTGQMDSFMVYMEYKDFLNLLNDK